MVAQNQCIGSNQDNDTLYIQVITRNDPGEGVPICVDDFLNETQYSQEFFCMKETHHMVSTIALTCITETTCLSI